jgi:hypothetical protein
MEKPPLSQLEQLKQALDAGLIEQTTFDTAVAGISAQLCGDGAIAQGDNTTAVGRGRVHVHDN